jgi:hypothetical protein
MRNESKTLKEIHLIRAEIYVETKDMTPSERAAYTNAQAQLLITELLQNGISQYKSKELKHQKTPNFIVLSYHILFFKN